jgi:catechol 2,3-dioxygenase-like lactoylglutathione lyase family enzyme
MIKAMKHVGISVSNLGRSISFYRDLLGMEVVVEDTFSGDQYDAILRLRATSGKVALLKSGDMQIELFEFSHPTPRHADPDRPVCDHGITHFCVQVDDVDDSYERLRASGVSFHCPPIVFYGTAKATYGRDPDGNVFELLQLAQIPERSATGAQ